MKQVRQHRLRRLLAAGAVQVLLLSASASQAADAETEAAADAITQMLSRDFYEIEFFVFERSDVMEFNSREVLMHRRPQPYPETMLALRRADEPYGSAYQIDASTRMCLTYPTLVYTISETDTPASDSVPAQDEPAIDQSPDASVAETEQLEAMTTPETLPEPVIDPIEELKAAVAAFETQLLERSDTWAEADSYQLSRAASLVRRRGNGRILFHGRWLQPVPQRERPMPVYIRGGSQFAGNHELNGSVGVTLGRYLHFQAQLNYAAPALGQYPIELASNADGSSTPVPAPQAIDGFMTLAQSRRMRSGELHYLDHPKLGIVVRIDPVEIPQSLIDMQLALEEGEQ